MTSTETKSILEILDDLTTKLKKKVCDSETEGDTCDSKPKEKTFCIIIDSLNAKLKEKKNQDADIDEAEKTAIVELGQNIQAIEKAHREIFTAVENYEKDNDAKSKGKSIREIEDDLTPKSKGKSIREILDNLTNKLEKEVSDAEKPAVVELGKNIQAIEKAYKEIFTVVEEYGKKFDDYSKQEDSKKRNENDLDLKICEGSRVLAAHQWQIFKATINELENDYNEKEEELKKKLEPQKPSDLDKKDGQPTTQTDQISLPQKASDIIDLKKIDMELAREKFAVVKTYGKQLENSFKELEDLYKKTMDKLGNQDKRGDIHIFKDAYAVLKEHKRTEPLKKQIELQKMLSDSLREWVQKTGEYFDVQKGYLHELNEQRISLQKLEKDKVNYNDFRQNRRAKFLEEVQFLDAGEVK